MSKILTLAKGYLRGKYRTTGRFLISKSSIARNYLVRTNDAGGDSSYCYGIWMQQLKYWATINKEVPKVVVEIGSGNSLGVGLAALISGSDKFYSLERTQFWNTSSNLRIFDELLTLFNSKENIEKKDSQDQTSLILNDEHMQKCLSEDRINKIRKELHDPFNLNNTFVKAIIPWKTMDVIENDSVDFIMSHTVLQHIDNISFTYDCMNFWLKKGGCMSHTIDFKSMNATKLWNGHWVFNDTEWKIATGGTSLINREPYSTHIKLLKKHNFEMLHEELITSENTLKSEDLASKFQHLDYKDLTTSGLFFFAVRKYSK